MEKEITQNSKEEAKTLVDKIQEAINMEMMPKLYHNVEMLCELAIIRTKTATVKEVKAKIFDIHKSKI